MTRRSKWRCTRGLTLAAVIVSICVPIETRMTGSGDRWRPNPQDQRATSGATGALGLGPASAGPTSSPLGGRGVTTSGCSTLAPFPQPGSVNVTETMAIATANRTGRIELSLQSVGKSTEEKIRVKIPHCQRPNHDGLTDAPVMPRLQTVSSHRNHSWNDFLGFSPETRRIRRR